MNYIISQVLGYIALLFMCISYFCRRKNRFMIYQMIGDVFYASSYMFLSLYVAGFITIISTMRCIIYYICEKYEYKHIKWFLHIFILGYVGVTVGFWTGLSDLVPLITGTLFTIAYLLKNVQAIRYTALVPNIMLIVYNISFRTYSNAILDIFETTVIVVSIITFHKLAKKEKEKIKNQKDESLSKINIKE